MIPDHIAALIVGLICLGLFVWSVVLTAQDNRHASWVAHVDDALNLTRTPKENQ